MRVLLAVLSILVINLLTINLSFAESILIGASANTQYALKEIVSQFKKKNPNTTIKISISSSGNITAQIEKGAPYDIFLSADMKYPKYLYKKGFAITKPKVYAEGILVLWSIKNKIKSIKDITKFKKIAIPNSKTAPYGKAGLEALNYYKLYKKVKNRLVYGESVRQASQYIYRGIVDGGFTAKSIVLSPDIKNKGYWIEINPKAYSPIKQAVVILKHGKNNKAVKKFFHYLFSQEAQNILMKYGYRVKK